VDKHASALSNLREISSSQEHFLKTFLDLLEVSSCQQAVETLAKMQSFRAKVSAVLG